jgi:hypothetical protein
LIGSEARISQRGCGMVRQHVDAVYPTTRVPTSVQDGIGRFSDLDAHTVRSMAPLDTASTRVVGSRRHSRHRSSRNRELHKLAARIWNQRLRLTIFAANGMNVFAAGLLIQVILVRYAHMTHVPSYVVQTIASVELSFVFSRYLTWGERKVAIMPALARFNMQQLIVTGLGMAGYAGLEQLGINYIVANVAVTALLTPASFLSSHKWSLTAH